MPEGFRVFPGGGSSGLEGVARDMIRISTIFIAICMVLVAASLGLVLYSMAGISGMESAIVALTALTFLILYNAVSMRLRDRTDVGGQIADLSRGTADLARQVAEFGRRLAAIEGKVVSANSAGADRMQGVIGEINELGVLVKQLATTVASHEEMLAAAAGRASPAACRQDTEAEPQRELPSGAERLTAPAPPPRRPPLAAAGRTLAQPDAARRRGEERGRGEPARHLPAADGDAAAAQGALLRGGDAAARRQGPGAGRRGFHRHGRKRRPDRAHRPLRDAALCAGAAPADGAQQGSRRVLQRRRRRRSATRTHFAQCLDFLEANRALAPSFVLEFKQATLRKLGPPKPKISPRCRSAAIASRSTTSRDLRIEPRELADRGVRFIKVPASLLLDPKQSSTSDIHPSDLSDLLGRFGIDLIAEKIEGERAVVDLLDYDVRFGQGFLFAPPRPLRPEGASATGGA